MENQLITEEKLNQLPKETIIMLLLSQNENFRVLSEQSAAIQKQNEQLLKQVEDLREQLAILIQQRFGRRSEKNLPINGQLSFDLNNHNVLNEDEILTENGFCEEPSMEETAPKRTPRPKGKRGSRYLRYALYNATKYVCHWDPTFAAYLTKKRSEGKHYNVAISHAVKKLVRVIYHLEKTKQQYLTAI